MAQPIPGSTLEDYKKLFWIIPVVVGVGVAAVVLVYFAMGSNRAPTPAPTPGTPVAPGVPDTRGEEDPDAVFCTMDAKMCPDGSFVGRIGPNCEFAPCPGDK